jgi:hypothetical protein
VNSTTSAAPREQGLFEMVGTWRRRRANGSRASVTTDGSLGSHVISGIIDQPVVRCFGIELLSSLEHFIACESFSPDASEFC